MFSSNTSQVSNDAVYIEDVFSTWLYTGTGSARTITNGIDLAGKGGLVWTKFRNGTFSTGSHILWDTARGVNPYLVTNTTAAQTGSATLGSFNSNGFTLDAFSNNSSNNFASWTFRKQPKFFDVVTYTGNGSATQTLSHSLGSVPGTIIVKCTSVARSWCVYHRSLGADKNILLNDTGAAQTDTAIWGNTSPTSTQFTVGDGGVNLNGSGATYVAYLFAHNAGGFGLTGTDNVISCGSYTTDGSGNATVTLGYEPQWIITKSSSANDGFGWIMVDNMRGWAVGGNEAQLFANSSGAEAFGNFSSITSTGFTISGLNASTTYIYIAIRRGPMKTPTSGTSVFAPVYVSAVAGTAQTTNFPVDAQILRYPQDTYSNFFVDRLRGVSTTPANQASPYLLTNTADAETSGPNLTYGWGNTGFAISSSFNNLLSIFWNFRRAPGFFDQVCYTGNGSSQTINHNLTVVPELVIFKVRTTTSNWWTTFNFSSNYQRMALDLLNTPSTISYAPASEMTAAPTSSALSLGNTARVNGSGNTYTAYLFASCPGVSKVGVVQITTAPQTVDCGFTSGARFVLIKSITDSSNSAYGWRVYDTARGITSGNDPVLYLNSTEGQTNTQNSINAVASGFQITGNDPYLSSGSFIYLAIA